MKRLAAILIGVALLAALAVSAVYFIPDVRSTVRSIVRPVPPPQITPRAIGLPPTAAPATPPAPTATSRPTTAATTVATAAPSATPLPTATPEPSPTPGPVEINGVLYDAYIPAATKDKQAYKYSCEFDAAWVILQTYGIEASVDDLVNIVGVDASIEPWIEETRDGFIIHGGDITQAFNGNIRENFLARSTGQALRKAFTHFDLTAEPVHDRAGIETALRSGQLIWMKTTVDFKPWRPATWLMPDGRTIQTVLGNDHAVVVMGFSQRGVVIRDVLGPTSSNWQRLYEYEVGWDTFLASWGAQEFDGLAVGKMSG